MLKKIFFLIFIFSFVSLSAQSEQPLVTDRPDKTESAIIVPLDAFQIETGFSYQKSKFTQNGIEFRAEDFSFAGTLLRYGINSFMEFRFGGEFAVLKSKIGDIQQDQQGLRNLMIGTKIQLFNEDKSFINAAVLAELGMPYGNSALRPEKFEPVFKITVSKTNSRIFSFGANAGLTNDSGFDEFKYLLSGALGITLTERVGMFAEYYGNSRQGMLPENYFQTGITYLQRKNVQIDFSLAKRISEQINFITGSLGFSVRF